jgi:hypothetical protein
MRLTEWRKSSYSGEGNSDCVEVAWRKSSHSGDPNGDCVEVALCQIQAAVRDSKNAIGPQLGFPSEAWRSFVKSMPLAAT